MTFDQIRTLRAEDLDGIASLERELCAEAETQVLATRDGAR